MCRTDTQLGHPARPVRLVRYLRHHHLRRAGPGGRRRRARTAVVHDGGHPREQCLMVDLADDEAVVPVVDQRQVGPAAGDDRATALRADRLDGDPGDVLRGAHTAEAHVHRRRACVQERLQVGGQRAVVGQDPRAGLHDIEIRRPRPRSQRRVGRQPRAVGEDVVADVVDRRQAERRPMGVERRAVERLHPLGIHLPQHPVVGLARRKRLARPRHRRLMRRRKRPRMERHEHIRDAPYLGHRPRACRHQARRHQRVTSLGCRGDRLELRGDQLRRHPRRVGGCRRLPVVLAVHQLAHRLARRHHRHADAGQQVREIRRCAHPHLRAEFPQLPPRVPTAVRRPRATPTSTTTHAFRNPISAGSGFGQRFWGMTRVLPQAPRVRYMLKVGRECCYPFRPSPRPRPCGPRIRVRSPSRGSGP